MSLGKNNNEALLHWLQDQVDQNRQSIFGDGNHCFRIIQVGISRPLHRKSTGVDDRYHRIFKVTYETNRGLYTKKIWLKFIDDFERLFNIHCAIYDQFQGGRKFFPKPYFHGKCDGDCVIAMEFVEGVSLRSMLIKNVAYHRIKPLEKVFLRMGTGMRAFHDSSTSSGVRLVGELADNARRVTGKSQYLTDAERKELIRHIGLAERQADPQTELPMIKIHNDWVMRNILIKNTGAFYVVDLDSMGAPDNSRWYDLSYFLINMESHLKYWPIVGRTSLVNLWKNFWQGYSEKGVPEALSKKQLKAIMNLIKIEYLFGGTIRPPLFEIYKKFLGPRYVRNLKKAIMRGEYSTLSVEL